MTAGRIIEYDQASETLLAAADTFCAAHHAGGVDSLAVTKTVLATHVPQIVQAFREGGGVPYAAFRPEFTDTWTRWAGASLTGCWSATTFRSPPA